MDRTEVINTVARAIGANRYLEIGVKVPERNYDLIEVDKKTGVDPSVEDTDRNVLKMTSDEFFASLPKKRRFDLIFIDGSHMYEQVQRDVANALNRLAKGGAVLMHDVNPENALKAAPIKPSYGAAWSGEAWKVFVEARANYSGATIAEDHGTGILVSRLAPRSPALPQLTFDVLKRDRQALLNIIDSTPAAIEAFISNA